MEPLVLILDMFPPSVIRLQANQPVAEGTKEEKTKSDEFIERFQTARANGFVMDRSINGSGVVVSPGCIVYHMVKCTPEEERAKLTGEGLPQLESMKFIEPVATKDPEEVSVVDKLLAKGYKVTDKFSKLIVMEKWKLPEKLIDAGLPGLPTGPDFQPEPAKEAPQA